MNSNLRNVRKIVETAIRMLDENGWSPAFGGVWSSKHVDVTVEFNKPTRFCTKASYRVKGSEIGVWMGYLNGASHKNIGKPVQVYTPEQLARELELSCRSLESIVAAGLNT
jgi:hypothetical protein